MNQLRSQEARNAGAAVALNIWADLWPGATVLRCIADAVRNIERWFRHQHRRSVVEAQAPLHQLTRELSIWQNFRRATMQDYARGFFDTDKESQTKLELADQALYLAEQKTSMEDILL